MSSPAAKSPANVFSAISPFVLEGPWHLMQYILKKGLTKVANSAGFAAGCATVTLHDTTDKTIAKLSIRFAMITCIIAKP
jgi:hypothetical protein